MKLVKLTTEEPTPNTFYVNLLDIVKVEGNRKGGSYLKIRDSDEKEIKESPEFVRRLCKRFEIKMKRQ